MKKITINADPAYFDEVRTLGAICNYTRFEKLISEKNYYSEIKITEKNYWELFCCEPRDIIYFKVDELSEFYSELFRRNMSNVEAFLEKYDGTLGFGIVTKSPKGNFLPSIPGLTINSKISRLVDLKFWRRRLGAIFEKELEKSIYKNGKIRLYSSSITYKNRLWKEENNKKYLQETVINDGQGTVIPMAEIVKMNQSSIANERLKVAKSMEKFASDSDYEWVFITTTPKRSMMSNSRNYDGVSTPVEQMEWHQQGWKKVRARFSKTGYSTFGVHCTEPFKQGGFHRHYLIYAPKERLLKRSVIDEINRLMSKAHKGLAGSYGKQLRCLVEKITKKGSGTNTTVEGEFLKEFFHHRMSVKIVRQEFHDDGSSKGSPTSYLFKYLFKSVEVDGSDLPTGENSEKPEQSNREIQKNMRVKAAQMVYKFRRYSFFGIRNCLTIYRETMRLKHMEITLPKKINDLFQSALSRDFMKFLDAFENVNLLKEERVNAYGDTEQRVIGIVDTVTGESVITRLKKWQIIKKSDLPCANDSEFEFERIQVKAG